MIELTEEETKQALKDLEKGKSVTIGDTTYFNLPEPAPNCDEHYFEDAGMESEFIQAVKCKDCINGRLIDTRVETLTNGKIIRH